MTPNLDERTRTAKRKTPLTANNFEVIDLGTDVSSESFITACKEHSPDILGMSTLLTTTMPIMSDTINAIESAGLRNGIKIIVGGAPITPHFADQIGADGYGNDGGAAIRLCCELLTKQQSP